MEHFLGDEDYAEILNALEYRLLAQDRSDIPEAARRANVQKIHDLKARVRAQRDAARA